MRGMIRLAAAGLMAAAALEAQESRRMAFDVSGSYREGRHAMSLAWHHQFNVMGPVWLGYGVRGSAYLLSGQPFTLADGSGPGTITMREPRSQAINLFATADVRVATRFGVGGNLDLAGFSTGDRRYDPVLQPRPQKTNLWAAGSDSRGTLAAEGYGSYHLSGTMHLRGGVTWYRVGILTGPENSTLRYASSTTAPFLSLRWTF